ncbi:hypothetical protein BGZ96_004254 [Linnemannia gamsii]|uniref:Uncharacterized protein n=1 Tax=Linnemannia gamsii TaxID=64522 RepID=A0ABQ7KG08_9FUNG|nr:hypothetical protein BGZ96_004254 [Linnemannia gamsii]
MRQQTQPPHPTQGVGSPQNPQNMNLAQRPPQRPTGPPQPQPPRQQQGPGSVPPSPHYSPSKETHASSPPAHGHDGQLIDGKTSQGEHGRGPNASPQQHNNQRPANPQGPAGVRPYPQQGPPGPAGFSGSHHAPRPLQAPGSPMQRPLGSAEIKLPGPLHNMAPRQAPAPQQPQHPQQLQQLQHQELQQPVTLVEPDAPPSDSEGAYDEDDDIEGGGSREAPPKSPATHDVAPLPQAKPAASGPPLGPPRGPPKGESHRPRKLSGAAGTGPVHIMQPSNNPSSPPASAFPTLGQPKPRVRPPPGNSSHTPYRPPERPSQAPVMYSQSGQPTFTSPFPTQGEKESSPAKSMVPQGADATSSSIRPREGGLQKRVVAADRNTTKSDSPAQQAPPSPKLHGLKGPAILSVSNHRTSSSKVKSLKTWAIRGGLVYLGYTAVFSCPPETTGIKGLYCKTTNGIGGLIKPFVAPHYNAHLGPHVDRYVAPVALQCHRIYVKVADPVVQGAFSAAGTVYKSTAKKHVDSAKDQMYSILPYPFKPKLKAADKRAEESATESAQDQSHFEKISRQPIHAQDPDHASDSTEETTAHDERIIEPVDETFEEKVNDVAEHAQEVVVNQATPNADALAEEETESFEEPVAVKEAEAELATETEEIKQDEASGADDDTNAVEADVDEPVKSEASEGSIFEKMAALKDSLKGLREDVKEPESEPEPEQEVKSEEVSQTDEDSPVDSQVPSDHAFPEEISPPTVEEAPSTESVEPTAESTVEFADKPTVQSEDTEPTPTDAAEIVVETPVVAVPEETEAPESVESPVIEEEIRETLPIETESRDSAAPSEPESFQPKEHVEEHVEEHAEAKKEVEGESVAAEGVEQREEQRVKEEEVKEEEEEDKATFEQQAAPTLAPEVGGEAGHKGHDEL